MTTLNNLTDQEIIDFLKQRKSLHKEMNNVISSSLETNFKKHNILISCPKCGSVNYFNNGQNANGTKKYKCKNCSRSFTAITNTIFEGTAYSWDEMVNIIHMLISKSSMIDISANTATEKLGTSWMILHKIMYLLDKMSDEVRLSDVIQIDEKYFREVQKGSHSLTSFLQDGSKRYARKHNYASKCGIFGPEFVNVLCAVDSNNHYWAKCVCLGPMNNEELEMINPYLMSVSYICTDMNEIYYDWCNKNGYSHYVEPSTYRMERKVRGYIDTDNIYYKLSEEEYKKDEVINREMYKERRYPHIRNSDKPLSFDEFNILRYKFNLGINRVNSFHALLERYLVTRTTGVSSVYLQNYIGTFVYLQNYKTDHEIKAFTKKDAEQILVEMIRYTLVHKNNPKNSDITNMTLNLRRPTQKKIKKSKRLIKDARKVIHIKKDEFDQSGFEGDDESSMYIFNKYNFFSNMSGKRLNELIKEFDLYEKGAHKKEKVKKLCNLSNNQEIIFREIYLQNYGSLKEFESAINCDFPKKQPKKRGRPKGSKNKKQK